MLDMLLDGLGRDPEPLRDFIVRKLLFPAEQIYLPHLCRHMLHGMSDHMLDLLQLYPLFAVSGRGLSLSTRKTREIIPPCNIFPDEPYRHIFNARLKIGENRTRHIKCPPSIPETDKHFLYHIPPILPGRKDSGRIQEHWLPVTPVQHGERIRVVLHQQTKQSLIRHLLINGNVCQTGNIKYLKIE